MSVKRIEALIAKKQQEIDSYEIKLAEIRGYKAALKDLKEMLPNRTKALKPGSRMHQAYQAIERAGHPLHVKEIINQTGRPDTKKEYTNMMSGLNENVSQNRYFCRTDKATFGLLGVNS